MRWQTLYAVFGRGSLVAGKAGNQQLFAFGKPHIKFDLSRVPDLTHKPIFAVSSSAWHIKM
jgi:hypothetical protein